MFRYSTQHSALYTVNGDHHSPEIHDHVILPKKVTDDFYSTLTQCYEELFHSSLLPKYVATIEPSILIKEPMLTEHDKLLHKCNSDPAKYGPTRRSRADLNEVVHRRKDIMKDLNHRLSFDLSQLQIDWDKYDDVTTSNIAKKYLDADYLEKTRSTDELSTRGKSNIAKWLPGRRKTYKLS